MTKSVKAYAVFLPELRQLLAAKDLATATGPLITTITDLISTTTYLVLATTILIREVR